jgi:hypothetical protein
MNCFLTKIHTHQIRNKTFNKSIIINYFVFCFKLMAQLLPINQIVQSEDLYNYSSNVPDSSKFKGGWFQNPRATHSKRPRLGPNPLLPYGQATALNYGSKAGFRAQFQPIFATKIGFDNFKRANPKTMWTYAERDIDGDAINEALVLAPDGQYVGVNGMTQRANN